MTTRRGILTAAITLTSIAFLGSLGHVYATVDAHDADAPQLMTLAISLMPEVTVALVTVKLLREGPRQPVAWLVGATALAFSVLANLSQRAPGDWGFIVALWPAWTSVGAMLLVHSDQKMTKAEAAVLAAERQREAAAEARRAADALEEQNRIEAARLELERQQLAQHERELAQEAEQRKAAERAERRQQRTTPPPDETGAEDILLPAARKAAERIRNRGETVTRDRLRDQLIADGKLTGGRRNERAGVLLQQLKTEERRAG